MSAPGIRQRNKRMWADPVYRAKMIEVLRTIRVKAGQASKWEREARKVQR